MPDFDLISIEYYKTADENFLGSKKGKLDLNVDRGCPCRCAFCYNIEFNKRRWRALGAEKILSTIEGLQRKYNVGAINFVSDNFFVDKGRIYKICRGMLDRKIDIKWHADIRVDTFLHYEDELIELIKRSGCDILTFGVESGSDRILKLIDKDILVEDVFKANNKAKSFGFRVNYHFMIGFPEETRKDVLKTLSVVDTLMRDKNVNIYGPAIYTPYPGTPLYDRCLQMGFKPPNSLEGWINYDWHSISKLPMFSKGYINYLNEIRAVCMSAVSYRGTKKTIATLVYLYFRLRMMGLRHGIRLFNLDIKLTSILKNFWQWIRKGGR